MHKIRRWRKACKYSLNQASAMPGVSVGYLSEVETGKRNFTTRIIQKFLNADPDFFRAEGFSALALSDPFPANDIYRKRVPKS